MVSGDETKVSQNCVSSNSSTDIGVYGYAERELNSSRTLFLSEFLGKQEPGTTDEEIMNGIRYVRPGNNFQTNITFFRKIEVNGANDHPLYSYLKKSCPTTRDFFEPIARLIYSPLRNNDVRWNFEKFLIDRKGKPVKRYDASTRVSDMRVDIESLVFPSVEFVYGS
ncbi:glutathione peroxidase 1-like [Daphnia pulex]|uniref:glutathione peroxidase 1-like n=1 Tax=Daphnia pulex TaxID=6669 RepID=UPI001EDF3F10|nr:glutathione peroxidase 1-like [Daphnia pulex]